ncbi:MAG: NAD-glutamate dehydrogenase [Alphaproteobacteria bacterium]|nr:NAD-glutamate dehydrogenase [Alphaproteobacteria bacterium]
MNLTYQERVNAALSAIMAAVPKNASQMLAFFTRQFFAKMPLQDLEKIDPAYAAAVAASAFEFMGQRTPAAPKIRSFTPRLSEHGYDSHHLVVELINDDMPFLVDSLSAELTGLGLSLHETIHPIFQVVRDEAGKLRALGGEKAAPESFIHFELSTLPAGITPEGLQAELEQVLNHVRAAVFAWKPVLAKVEEAEADLAPVKGEEAEEARQFLRWLKDRNFVFLGYADAQTKLGICTLDARIAAPKAASSLLDITKSDRKSLVHRPVLMDVIMAGARQFIGLFTSIVYYQSAEEIPFVRRKIAGVVNRAGFDPVSHDGKELKTILEFLPRDEMFQYGEEELFEVALGILALENKPAVRLFVRRDLHERFVSCMAFVPREFFSTGLRKTIMQALAKAYQGEIETFNTQITDAPLARLHFIVRTTPGMIPPVDIAALEAEIARATHLWSDELRAGLARSAGEERAEALMRVFAGAFPQSYIYRYNVGAIVHDINKCNEAMERGGLALDIYRLLEEPDYLHLKIYNPSEEIALSDILPMLEHFGLRAIEEHPFLVSPHGASSRTIWIRDFKLKLADADGLELAAVKPNFEEALLKVWHGEMESDRFNALVLKAGLNARQVTVLRAYARYLRQIGFTYSQTAIEQAFYAYPQLSRTVMALFAARFDPDAAGRDARETYLAAEAEEQLSNVKGLTEDRILREYVALIRATLRTNYFQADKPVLSFKLRSADVPGLPKPVPFAEIFVYSARVEGIHLRGGKVARGGIRWSDRPEDFRTEVLGLMKAQMVKNAVIVPTGSKGGFVVKKPPATREAMQEEGIACYRAYLSGLLDITDNIVKGEIMPPPRVVRHDGDDPYLVVAADKGTASFSDIANALSADYGFWLDDAFASGGSAGYDHKKMGITARGAWVSVTRHFREMGVDIETTPFTVAGIGDMSGDVFGNGMLLSENIRLIAAFNHLHIFIDPDPDPRRSFAERQRLFALPRSGWQDYDAATLSSGGGIYERSAKTIRLSPQAAKALGADRDSFTPDELVRAILLAPVDLLWNGGIGTYVKADAETHEQVGDRANNAVRVNGSELRCKVVGEGGNLGFTQKGRIEYARNGGRINTDAIDNSGGVDCSDHEVNIKIAFARALSEGRLTREARNATLVAMTEEVAGLVLKDNFLQTQAITGAQVQGLALLESQARLMRRLEKQGLLNRGIESLPSDAKLAELAAAGKGLSRPEIAVLLAYGKIALSKELIDTTLPDEPYFATDLARYFPKAMREAYMEDLEQHPLKREITATVATNSLVNRVGLTFFFDLLEETGQPAREVAAAYTIARDAFALRHVWKQIEILPAHVDTALQVEMQASIARLVERFSLWVLARLPQPLDIEAAVAKFAPRIAAFRENIEAMHSPFTKAAFDTTTQRLEAAGVPYELAAAVAGLGMMASAGDIIQVAEETELPLEQVGKGYFAAGSAFSLGWLRAQAEALPAVSHWDRLAARAVIQELFAEQRRLTAAALAGAKDAEAGLAAWKDAHKDAIARLGALLADLTAREQPPLSALMVALRAVKGL